MNLFDICYLVFRNKWLILTGVVLGIAAGIVYYKLAPAVYRSEAKLLVRYVSDTVSVAPSVTGESVVTPGRSGDTVINDEVDILSSAELVSAVAAQLAAQAATAGQSNPVPQTVTADLIARHFHVEAAPRSNTLLAAFDSTSPQLSQLILQRLIDAYLQKHQEVHRDPGAFEFITRQTDEMRRRLDDTEEELRSLKSKLGIASLVDARLVISTRLQELDRSMRECESALAETTARRKTLEQELARLPASAKAGINESAVSQPRALSRETRDAAARLGELRQREFELLSVYTSNSLPVHDLRRQIRDLETVVYASTPSDESSNAPVLLPLPSATAGTASEALLAEYRTECADESGLIARAAALREQQAQATQESQKLEASEGEIARLERTKEIHETNYRYFSQRLEQARIDNAMDASKVSNIAIVQPPTLPVLPEGKQRIKILFAVFAICAGAGVAIAVLREYVIDNSIRHPHDIPRRLKLPLLAILPLLQKATKKTLFGAAKPLSDATATASLSATQTWLASCEVVAQIIRHLSNRQEGALRIGFTAPHRGAGVTLVASKIAEAIHLSGAKSVLLASISAEGLLVAKELGAADAEIAAEEILNRKPASDGAEEWSPVKIPFSSPAPLTPRIMAELNRQDYDCILYDLPPLDGSDSAVRLLPHLHGVILVVETGQTTIAQAQRCITFLQALQCQSYGVILNKFTSPLPRWISPPPALNPTPPPLAALPPSSSKK